jgi:glycosyltransferase involved in cell wall biosynthesis
VPRGGLSPLRHLGLNAVFLQPRMGGIETYVRCLYPALLEVQPALRISVFVNEHGRALLAAEPWAAGVELVTHPLLGRRGMRALSEAILLGSLADRRGCEVLHSVALTAPLRLRSASVVTIPDVTWLREVGAVPLHTRLLWRALVFPAARRADRVIAHSRAAASEIAEDMEVPKERIDVIPHGPGVESSAEPTPEPELRARLGLGPGPIVLAVSALLAHKNVGSLVEALPEIKRAAREATVVVPANPTPLGEQLAVRARALGVGGALILPGWVSPSDLEGLYAAASCFVLPSFREGFGLPVLEAMRRGVPVACSNASALPEVAGEAALMFDPNRSDELADAVTRLLRDRDLAEELAARGRVRAAQFTWRRAAVETLASFERARQAP